MKERLRRGRPYFLATMVIVVVADLWRVSKQIEFMNDRRAKADQIQRESIAARERMEAMLRELVNRP